MKNSWYKKGIVFGIIVLFISMSVLSSVSSRNISILIMENHPPSAPQIIGTQVGKPGTYEWMFKSFDPDGDKISYYVDWGDGDFEDWFGPYNSGEEVARSHTYTTYGAYLIKAQANDTYGALSDWSTMPILISKKHNTEAKQETTIRIHRATGITPYTLKLTEKESDEVDRIFDTLQESLSSAVTDEGIDKIFNDAVVSLYELGLFPKDMTVVEAQQLVKGKSQNQNVMSSSGNLETGDENFNCMIAGETSTTYMFDLGNAFLNRWLEFFRTLSTGMSTWWPVNLDYYHGKIGQISFGHHYHPSGTNIYTPANGWVWTDGTNDIVEWQGKFYGDIYKRLLYEDLVFKTWEWVYIGVDDFRGFFIDYRDTPSCYLGNAEHVSFSYNQPSSS